MEKDQKAERVCGASEAALSLIELVVIIAGVVILVALFLPGLARSKARSSRLNCNNNMKQIGLAFRSWSFDENDLFPMHVSTNKGGSRELVNSGNVSSHFEVMSNELSTPKVLKCPNDLRGTYATSFARGFGNSNLSYFVGVDAIEGDATSVLSGDRNLTNPVPGDSRLTVLTTNTSFGWTEEMHGKKGYVCFADGSVRGLLNAEVLGTVRSLGSGTNRLAVP